MRNRQGAALVLVVVIALLCAIAAYVVLMAAVSGARMARVYRERTEARHLAEAALVIAMEKLWVNPNYCGVSESVDTNSDGTGDTAVPITVTNCGAGNAHTLKATVTY